MADSPIAPAITSLCRMVLNLRLVALLLTILWIPERVGELELVVLAIVVAGVLSLVPLLQWERVGPMLVRHPSFVAVDMLFALVMLAVLGPASPFLYYVVGTALLAGTLHGGVGAAFFATLLMTGHVTVVLGRAAAFDVEVSYHLLIVLPMLYPLAAAGAVGVRRLLVEQRTVRAALEEQTRSAAASEERARLAREVHDSLAKTIHGIALSATALPGWVERSPDRATALATQIASASSRAAAEARELIADLRTDRLDLPLDVAILDCVEEFRAGTGLDVETDVEPVGELTGETRYELFCVVKEALRNVARHADANRITVHLRSEDDLVVVEVSDDGRGIEAAPDLDALAAAGHYGLVGMSERAERVGGSLVIDKPDGGGTRIRAAVPPQQRRSAHAAVREEIAT